MNIKYDSAADALYIRFRSDSVARTEQIEDDAIVDFNKQGEVIGLEVLFVRERNPDFIKNLKITA